MPLVVALLHSFFSDVDQSISTGGFLSLFTFLLQQSGDTVEILCNDHCMYSPPRINKNGDRAWSWRLRRWDLLFRRFRSAEGLLSEENHFILFPLRTGPVERLWVCRSVSFSSLFLGPSLFLQREYTSSTTTPPSNAISPSSCFLIPLSLRD